MFSVTDASISSPSSRRSSVTKAIPLRMLLLAVRLPCDSPPTSIVPDRYGSSPNRIRPSSVRPEPINPNNPRISPSCRSNEISLTIPGSVTLETDSSTLSPA